MLIRMCTIRADIPRIGEGIAYVRGEIQPEIAAMDGNNGFVMAVDRSSSRYVSVAAWTDNEALEASADRAPGLIGAVARRLGAGEPSVEVFELAFAQVVKPVRVGYWGRLTRAEIPTAHLDRAVRNSRTRRWLCSNAMTGWPRSSYSSTGPPEWGTARSAHHARRPARLSRSRGRRRPRRRCGPQWRERAPQGLRPRLMATLTAAPALLRRGRSVHRASGRSTRRA